MCRRTSSKAKDNCEDFAAAKRESITVGKNNFHAMQAEDAGDAMALCDAEEVLVLTLKTCTDVKFLLNLRHWPKF